MAEEECEIEYLIDEDLGDNGGVLRVRDVEELEKWLQAEQEFWSWLSEDPVSNIAHVNQIAGHVTNILSQIRSNFAQVEADNNPTGHLAEIRILLDQYRQRTLLHSSAPEASFVERLREDAGPIEAAAALGTYINRQINHLDFKQFHGAVAAALFTEGATSKTAPAVRRSLKILADEYSGRYAEDTKAADVLRDRLENLVSNHGRLQQRGTSGIAQAVRIVRRQGSDQREAAAKRLTEFEDIYNTKLALDAPVSYWRKKRFKHRIAAGVLFVAFIVYIAAALRYGIPLVKDTPLGTLEFWQKANLGVSAIVFIVVGIGAALARVLLRLAMSQLHLSNDADERVTMVNTYLALRQADHANEDQMQVVIERLFAPATDGLVKEDLGAVTMGEAAKSLLTRR